MTMGLEAAAAVRSELSHGDPGPARCAPAGPPASRIWRELGTALHENPALESSASGSQAP